MMRKFALVLVAGAMVTAGCEWLDTQLTIDGSKGLVSMKGAYSVDLPQGFVCGDPIQKEGYKVISTKNGNNCDFSFAQEVTVLQATDYTSTLKTSLKTLKKVDAVSLNVSVLTVKDGAGATIELGKAVTALSANVYGAPVVPSLADVARLPFKVTLPTEAVNKTFAQLNARQPLIMPVSVQLSVPLDPPPPAQINVDFEATPIVTATIGV